MATNGSIDAPAHDCSRDDCAETFDYDLRVTGDRFSGTVHTHQRERTQNQTCEE